MFSRLAAQCPNCPKTVAINLGAERLIVHDTLEGEECAGSGAVPPSPEVPSSPAVAEGNRKRKTKAGSVWTISGGLPSLGKRR